MTVLEIIGYAGYAVGAVLILASKTKSDNLNDLKERVSILEKEREYGREQHIENQKAISKLEGQLTTYKEIPLQSIASSLSELSKSNQSILATLQGTKKNGGMLVKTEEKHPLDVKVKE